jgi:hypothetical protein
MSFLRAFMLGAFEVLVHVDMCAVDGWHVQIFGFLSRFTRPGMCIRSGSGLDPVTENLG